MVLLVFNLFEMTFPEVISTQIYLSNNHNVDSKMSIIPFIHSHTKVKVITVMYAKGVVVKNTNCT